MRSQAGAWERDVKRHVIPLKSHCPIRFTDRAVRVRSSMAMGSEPLNHALAR